MWVPSTSRGLSIDLRRGLIPLSFALLMVAWFVFHPPLWVMLILATLLPMVFAVEWFVVGRRRPRFEREFSSLLQHNDVTGLHELVDGWSLFRLFAPAGYLDEKRGLIASLEGNWYLADKYLERAYVRSNDAMRKALLPAILRAKYENGMWDEAEEIAQQLVGRSRFPGTPELFLGLVLARRPDDRDEAVKMLERARDTLGGPDKERAEKALGEIGIRY